MIWRSSGPTWGLPHRARYYSSVVDVENLDAGQDFHELPDSYIIFITEKDFFRLGKPVYKIQRMNLTTGELFADSAFILYVNGEYRGNDEIGALIHDFNCTDAKDMKLEPLASRTRYLKENPEGVRMMCKVMEDMRDRAWAEGRAEGRAEGMRENAVETAKRMLLKAMSPDMVAELSGLSLEVQALSHV